MRMSQTRTLLSDDADANFVSCGENASPRIDPSGWICLPSIPRRNGSNVGFQYLLIHGTGQLSFERFESRLTCLQWRLGWGTGKRSMRPLSNAKQGLNEKIFVCFDAHSILVVSEVVGSQPCTNACMGAHLPHWYTHHAACRTMVCASHGSAFDAATQLHNKTGDKLVAQHGLSTGTREVK
jgi:hypothetical protein